LSLALGAIGLSSAVAGFKGVRGRAFGRRVRCCTGSSQAGQLKSELYPAFLKTLRAIRASTPEAIRLSFQCSTASFADGQWERRFKFGRRLLPALLARGQPRRPRSYGAPGFE